ncbi:MAG TPA: extracellular solute-binding protein, partial [Anaerolineales bacterium]|nr:extracellular solute-binding protein [Anaerolineales bacterium]
NLSILSKVVAGIALLVLLVSCAPAATPAPAPTAAPAATAAPTAVPATPTMGKAQDVITWWEYDQNNTDPKADEHVGNFDLAKAIPLFNKAFPGQWNWVNVPVAFDQKDAQLIAAVQAGGQVPDVFEATYSINTFVQHGTLQDLTDWAKAQSWFAAMDPSALKACTGPDGKLYCIPLVTRPQLVYVWKDRFPNGFPTSPDDFMTQAAALKAKGFYAMSYFGSTDNNGDGITRGMDTVLQSFGGGLDDGHGKMLLNTPQNMAAITFMRTIVADGYVPEIAFAGGFQEESAFNDSSAGSFPTSLNGYLFMNPLTAPSGKKYNLGNENDFLNAVTAGDIYLSPFFSAVAGQKPGCNIDITGLAIPVGATNLDGAHAYINWLLSAEENASFVAALGGFPALTTSQSDPLFQQAYYTEASKVLTQESCKPWFGSLVDPAAAQPIAMTVLYQLIKQNPNADMAAALTSAQDQYNSTH